MQPVGRHRENTVVVIGIIGGAHLLSLFCGGSRNLWRLSATLASATLSVPPFRSRQGFKPNLPRYIAAAAKQGCASKSDNQSPISGTGECGHITHGNSTPTLAQKLVGGVTWPCSILPTYSIGCAVRRATCTHAPSALYRSIRHSLTASAQSLACFFSQKRRHSQ